MYRASPPTPGWAPGMCGSLLGIELLSWRLPAKGSHAPNAAVWVKGEMCTWRQDGGIRSTNTARCSHRPHAQCPLGISPCNPLNALDVRPLIPSVQRRKLRLRVSISLGANEG